MQVCPLFPYNFKHTYITHSLYMSSVSRKRQNIDKSLKVVYKNSFHKHKTSANFDKDAFSATTTIYVKKTHTHTQTYTHAYTFRGVSRIFVKGAIISL